MKSLFAKLFTSLLAASVLVLAALSGMTALALKTSILQWNQGRKADMTALLVPLIAKAHRLNGGLSAPVLEDAISPYMTDSLYVYVLDEWKRPLLLMSRGRSLELGTLADSESELRSLIARNPPEAVRDGGETIGYLSADSIDFMAYRAGRRFVATMWRLVAVGVCIAVVIALGAALAFSSAFTRQARALGEGLAALARKDHPVGFPEPETRELAEISRAARSLQARLEREESLRRQWMQDISHDLRTPLAAIKAQFEAMSDGVLDCSRERIERLLAELGKVERLVGNLQELSRYESPEMRIAPTAIRSPLFLDDLRDRFSFLAEQRGLSFTVEGEELELKADEFLLQRCVSNVVQNALQYADPGGRIEVRLAAEGNGCAIVVENTGSIPDEDIGRIFDRLYRGERSRSQRGTGLGLSIAKAIMDLHGGRIEAGSSGGSVRFVLRFPALA